MEGGEGGGHSSSWYQVLHVSHIFTKTAKDILKQTNHPDQTTRTNHPHIVYHVLRERMI